MPFTTAEIIGSIGVFLLLIAFFLNLFGYWEHDARAYQSMNFVGAGLSCYSAYLIEFPPFVVLEGTWSPRRERGSLQLFETGGAHLGMKQASLQQATCVRKRRGRE